MTTKEIDDFLKEGLEETGSIEGAFDYVLENGLSNLEKTSY